MPDLHLWVGTGEAGEGLLNLRRLDIVFTSLGFGLYLDRCFLLGLSLLFLLLLRLSSLTLPTFLGGGLIGFI